MKKTINILDLVQNIMGAKLVHLEQISKSYWSHTGTFSLTNLSRWVLCTSKRSIERFYARPHDWSEHMGILIISFLVAMLNLSKISISLGFLLGMKRLIKSRVMRRTASVMLTVARLKK